MPMAAMATPATDAWSATLTLLRWRQTRKGYDADDALLQTSFRLLESDSDGEFGPQSALRDAEQRCNIPADRIATELLHFALLLITKPRRVESGAKTQSSGVLRLLHLTLKALRATTTTTAGLSIPMNACNMLLAAMADALESLQPQADVGESETDATSAVNDVLQVFVFLFGMEEAESTPSFNMYKPPTNVFSEFMQRACSAIFAQLDSGRGSAQNTLLVHLAHVIMRVFQELQHTQVNKKKVFVSIAKTSLRDIVNYRHALSQHVAIDGVAAVLALLDRIIVDALFDPEHLREYDGALVHIRMWSGPQEDADDSHKPKKAKRKQGDAVASSLVSYQRHLFDEIKSFLTDSAVSDDAMASIGALLHVLVGGYSTRIRAAAHDKIQDTRADVKSSKKRVASVIASTSTAYTPFKFWAELCGVVFQCGPPQATLVALVDALFAALCDADVYRVTEDSEDQEQFAMMQRILAALTDSLLNHDGGVATPAIARHVGRVLAHAVQCTPNLVHQSLAPVLRVLSLCSRQSVDAASLAIVKLLHAYESMRLVDAFLKACCTVADDTVADGLHAALAHRDSEAALRRTFLSLPPGQLEIVWRLLTDTIAVLGGRQPTAASHMAMVRGIFALFLQEIHITPQNRTKIGELMTETHDKLLSTLASKTATHASEYSSVQREIFSLFGECLALYDGLAPATRAQTLGVVIEALGSRLVTVLTKLLTGSDAKVVGAAAGVIKIGIHSLRRRQQDEHARIAALIVDRVMQWKCWDAVAFYLPELVGGVTEAQATELFAALVSSSLGAVTLSDHTAAARILRDAAFFEIHALQQVAPAVFTKLVKAASDATTSQLFEFLLAVPTGYLDPTLPSSQELLAAALQLHLKMAPGHPVQPLVAQWIDVYLLSIATQSTTTTTTAKTVNKWLTAQFLDAPVDKSTARLLRVAIEYARVDAAAVATPLTKLVHQNTPRALSTVAIVVEAAAPLHQLQVTVDFVTALIAKTKAQPSLLTSSQDTSFQLFTALLQFLAALPDASPLRHPIQQLLRPHVATTLSTAMQSVVHTHENTSHRQFFATVCACYHALDTAVTLETFGCLLAVALSTAHVDDTPLSSLVVHSSKDEFRLLVSTLLQELLAPAPARVLAALKALALVLEAGDRKLSPSRRQLLGEVKATFVERIIHVAGHALAQPHPSTVSVDTVVASLKAVVLFYCKAELFTWKQHELLQAFAGFAPLHAITGTRSTTVWTAGHIHSVWLLSYNLLLRIVRHHFSSLVHAVPHVVSALNALLRVLLAAEKEDASTLEWASNLARLYGYLKPHDAALRKHVVYLLVPYLRGVTQGKLSLAVQLKLRPGVFALLEICSLNEKEQLYASLDAAGKSLLKALDTQYKLSHRYVGKV